MLHSSDYWSNFCFLVHSDHGQKIHQLQDSATDIHDKRRSFWEQLPSIDGIALVNVTMKCEESAWVRHTSTWEELDKFKCPEAKCREKTLEKSGLEPTAPNRLADRKHCALSTQPNRRWGFDKAQCFRSARWFGAVGSSPDSGFPGFFHDIWHRHLNLSSSSNVHYTCICPNYRCVLSMTHMIISLHGAYIICTVPLFSLRFTLNHFSKWFSCMAVICGSPTTPWLSSSRLVRVHWTWNENLSQSKSQATWLHLNLWDRPIGHAFLFMIPIFRSRCGCIVHHWISEKELGCTDSYMIVYIYKTVVSDHVLTLYQPCVCVPAAFSGDILLARTKIDRSTKLRWDCRNQFLFLSITPSLILLRMKFNPLPSP